MSTAKEQVAIIVKIMEAQRRHFRKWQEWPKALYIGFEDLDDLIREAEPSDISASMKPLSFRGLKVFRVDEPHHLNVAALDG